MPMGHAASDDWPEDYIIVVPHASRYDDLWRDIQTETQEQIGAALREMYAGLERLPLSPSLMLLVRQIDGQCRVRTAHG
jgi:hypothetical protein